MSSEWTEAEAETHAVLARILRTCRRGGRDISGALGELLRRGRGHILEDLAVGEAMPGRPADEAGAIIPVSVPAGA
jgi:hypothetical protein